MSSHDELHDDELRLPGRAVLDAWEVPMPASNLTDRVMARLDEPATVTPAPTTSVAARGGLGWAVVGVGMVAAAALVLGLVRLLEPTPPSASPEVVAVTSTAPRPTPPLVIRTMPVDAMVQVDGRPVAGPSPFSVEGLGPGPHRIIVTRDGFLAVERTIDPSVTSELPIELPHRDVVLTIIVDPPEAAVRLFADDEPTDTGVDGDRVALRRQAGVRYEIEATARGYLSRRVPVALTGEPDQMVRLTLVRDPDAAIEPPAAPVRAKGNTGRIHVAPAGRSPDLKDPFRSKSSSPATAKSAKLRIGTSPGSGPATVEIDGKRVGMTPLVGVKVTPGRHRVRFSWPDGETDTMIVDVGDGETRTIRAD